MKVIRYHFSNSRRLKLQTAQSGETVRCSHSYRTNMSEVKSYFDMHAHHSAYHRDPKEYFPMLEKIRTRFANTRLKILDVGCGDGSFMKAMILGGVKADYFGSDISSSMIKMAKQMLNGNDFQLFAADGFHMPINQKFKFDLIHIDSVLHHLISKTPRMSRKLARKMVSLLCSMLSENGILLVEEWYYESYVIPSISSSIIFYSLKLMNFLKLDLGKIRSDVIPGLEVNFFYISQLQKILDEYGTVSILTKDPGKFSTLLRIILTRDYGHVSCFVSLK
jgi:SAM-dependent methyltransferase